YHSRMRSLVVILVLLLPVTEAIPAALVGYLVFVGGSLTIFLLVRYGERVLDWAEIQLGWADTGETDVQQIYTPPSTDAPALTPEEESNLLDETFEKFKEVSKHREYHKEALTAAKLAFSKAREDTTLPREDALMEAVVTYSKIVSRTT
ncbi:hypothetical protein PMAYCL1PPCAC_14116, partial [Pristionchus mayeri]